MISRLIFKIIFTFEFTISAKGNCKLSERESNERVIMFNDSCQVCIN